jgi:hypothetical protein
MIDLQVIPALREDDCDQLDIGSVREFPRFGYSMKDVRRAGEVIAGELPWTDENQPEIRDAFQVANNWRDVHAYPMRSVRLQLAWYMRHCHIDGVTAARLKRMQAIRRKLRRLNMTMNQLQDLGGCRAILPSIADVHNLVGVLRERSRHTVRAENNYISEPKKDGYRSHHLMFSYVGKGDATFFDGRRVEVQIRTRLQHSWATAVEAVGLLRREDLKGNQGNPKWLRLFKLMSAEFAVAEGCPEPPDVPSQIARVAEIKALDIELGAIKTLDEISYAVRWTDEAVHPNFQPTYYLIEFDNVTREVSIIPSSAPLWAVEAYGTAESGDNRTGVDSKNIVLVEADKIENLKNAYPNYFGDVQLFKMQLKNIVKGKGAKEYIVKPQETVVPRPRENPDTGWLKRRIRWK